MCSGLLWCWLLLTHIWKFSVSNRSIHIFIFNLDRLPYISVILLTTISKSFVKFGSIWSWGPNLLFRESNILSKFFLFVFLIKIIWHHINKAINLERLHNLDSFGINKSIWRVVFCQVSKIIPICAWISTQVPSTLCYLNSLIFLFLSWSGFSFSWFRLFWFLSILFWSCLA